MPTNTEFPRASYRSDPYRNFRFRVKWDGRYIAGVSKVSALRRTTLVVPRSPSDAGVPPRRTPGQCAYAPITLERGVTHDPAFEKWANQVRDYHRASLNAGQEEVGKRPGPPETFRKDIILELYNEAGQKVVSYNIYGCWPSEFVALDELDANGTGIAIQTLTLEIDGWERDTVVAEPAEPDFSLRPR